MRRVSEQDRAILEAFEEHRAKISHDLDRQLEALGKPTVHEILSASKNLQHQLIHWLDLHRGLLSPEGLRQLDEMSGDRSNLYPRHQVLEDYVSSRSETRDQPS
jgi:hypothetical protein